MSSLNQINETITCLIPARVAHHYHFQPLDQENGVLKVLIQNADDLDLLDAIGRELGMRVVGVTEAAHVTAEGLKKYYGIGAETLEGLISENGAGTKKDAFPTEGHSDLAKL